MDERPRSNVSDRYSWQCSSCKCQLSMRNFLFFSKVIALAKVAPHAVIVGQDYPVSDAAEEVEISLMVAIDKISVVA